MKTKQILLILGGTTFGAIAAVVLMNAMSSENEGDTNPAPASQSTAWATKESSRTTPRVPALNSDKRRSVEGVAGTGSELDQKELNTKPLPRVLLIGDSITGSYQKQVFKDLDGEAKVFKNPGNAECSWNGVARVDEWLKLKRYLLNGQEYLELVDSIHKAMGNELERVCPEYADRGAELAGVVWFQGIDDGAWDAKAEAYEENLANLIRDIRKEFKAPELPFVIGALADAGGKMRPNWQKVFDAQMAVSDPDKHPEFKDNVISIDTRPMCFPSSEWPGGRDRYKGHAASYLKIGEAMGKAMLQLMKK